MSAQLAAVGLLRLAFIWGRSVPSVSLERLGERVIQRICPVQFVQLVQRSTREENKKLKIGKRKKVKIKKAMFSK